MTDYNRLELISQVFEQFRKDACLPDDDRISESFIKAAGDLMGARAEPVNGLGNTIHEQQLIDWLLRDPNNGESLKFAGPPEAQGFLTRVKMRSNHGDEWTLLAGFREGWMTYEERAANLLRIAKLESEEIERDATQSKPATRAVPVAIPEPDTTRYAQWAGDMIKYHSVDQLVEYGNACAKAALAAPTPDAERHVANHAGDADAQAAVPLTADDVEWIVNDIGELGVKIRDGFFFLYKGQSLVYEEGTHDDGSPMLWRMVGKREFGEVQYPASWIAANRSEDRYAVDLVYHEGLSFGSPEDGKWKPLPVAPAQPTAQGDEL